MGNIFIMGIWQKQSRKKSWEHHVESMIPMLNSWFPWLSHDFPIEQTKQILRWIGFSAEKKIQIADFPSRFFFREIDGYRCCIYFFLRSNPFFSFSWDMNGKIMGMMGVDHGKIHRKKIHGNIHGKIHRSWSWENSWENHGKIPWDLMGFDGYFSWDIHGIEWEDVLNVDGPWKGEKGYEWDTNFWRNETVSFL